MSENQTEESAILRELGKINKELGQIKSDVGQLKGDVGQIKEGQTNLQISVGKLETSMSYIKWIAIAGFSISIGVATFLDQKQSAKISQVENRLDANFAIQ